MAEPEKDLIKRLPKEWAKWAEAKMDPDRTRIEAPVVKYADKVYSDGKSHDEIVANANKEGAGIPEGRQANEEYRGFRLDNGELIINDRSRAAKIFEDTTGRRTGVVGELHSMDLTEPAKKEVVAKPEAAKSKRSYSVVHDYTEKDNFLRNEKDPLRYPGTDKPMTWLAMHDKIVRDLRQWYPVPQSALGAVECPVA